MALLTVDKSVYAVGQTPTYRITGGMPLARIAWSSFKNGQETGEFQADYGQTLDANGNATLIGGSPWAAGDVGEWEKQVLLIPSGYAGDYTTVQNAQVDFTVLGTASGGTVMGGSSANNSLPGGNVNIPGLGNVPLIAVAGAGIALFLIFSGKGGR